MKTVTKSLQGIIFAAGLAFAMPALAEGPPSFWSADTMAAKDDAGAVQNSESRNSDDVLSADELENLAGGTGVPTVFTQQNLSAFNGGNSVIGNVVGSGEINLGANTFSGFNGVGNFVLNTGHNNNLQSSLNVSILLPQ